MLFVYVDKLKVKTSRNVKRSFYKNLVQNTTHTERKLKTERREVYSRLSTHQYQKLTKNTHILRLTHKIAWRQYVQKHFPVRILVHFIQHRKQTTANLGQKSEKWTHQENHRSRYSKFCTGNCGHKCQHDIHNMSGWSKENTRNQIALSGYDCQEYEKVFHIWSPGKCSSININKYSYRYKYPRKYFVVTTLEPLYYTVC